MFSLGNQEHFADMFRDEDKNFTFLVPSNKAWSDIHDRSAAAYNVLFVGQFPYHSQSILEKHLRVDVSLSTEEMVNMTAKEGGVKMLRGTAPLRFRTVQGTRGPYTVVQWENIVAKITRPNLRCTNGYIHVIDAVLMQRRDITIAEGASSAATVLPTAGHLLAATAVLKAMMY